MHARGTVRALSRADGEEQTPYSSNTLRQTPGKRVGFYPEPNQPRAGQVDGGGSPGIRDVGKGDGGLKRNTLDEVGKERWWDGGDGMEMEMFMMEMWRELLGRRGTK